MDQEVFNESVFKAVREKYQKPAVKRTKAWENLIVNNQSSPVEDQLFETNSFFNKLEFKE